jgi:integrase
MPALMREIRADHSAAARGLELLILTAVRRDEARNSTWGEFNLDDGVWTIPGARMKTNKDHQVPLAPAVVTMLMAMRGGAGPDERLFNFGTHVMTRWLARHGVDATVHGMRSAFRDWCAECTNFPSEVAEAALAHTTGSAVERAYRRSTFFDRRRELASAWASFCAGAGADVVSLRAARK